MSASERFDLQNWLLLFIYTSFAPWLMSTIVNGRWLLFLVSVSLSVCVCHHSVFFFSLFFPLSLFDFWLPSVSLSVCSSHTQNRKWFIHVSRILESSLSQRKTTICNSFHSIFVAHAWYWCHLVVPFAPIFRSRELSLSWIAFKCKVNHLKMHRRWKPSKSGTKQKSCVNWKTII